MTKLRQVVRYSLLLLAFSGCARNCRSEPGPRSPQAWVALPGPRLARAEPALAQLEDGSLVIAGGISHAGYLSSVELIDGHTGLVRQQGALNKPRRFSAASSLQGGEVLVTGGYAMDGVLAACELYRPAANASSATGSMRRSRYLHTATLLADGRVLVAGGENEEGQGGGYEASAELFDPAGQTFSFAGALSTGRSWHTATRLRDGRVLIAGGEYNAGSPLATAEVFDPASGRFAATGPLRAPRSFHSATLLADGSVLVVGGRGGNAVRADTGEWLSMAERYEPSTGTWHQAGELATPRRGHGAIFLSSGEVMVLGGRGPDGPLSSVEIWNPLRESFRAAPSMLDARGDLAFGVLRSGRIWAAGGRSSTSFLSSAETF